MSDRVVDTSQRQFSVIAGLAYAVIIVLAVFAQFFVLKGLTDPDNAAATVDNIANSKVLFRSGIAAFVVVLVADAVVAWALYVFFQRTSRRLSLFAAWFRLIYVAIAAAALLNLLVAARLVDDTGYSTAVGVGQRNAHVLLSLDAYDFGWRIGLVWFGAHLLILGILIVKSDYAPRPLGILVAVAGTAYVVSELALIVTPNDQDHKDVFLMILAVLAAPGEFGLTGWLLWKGGKGRAAAGQRAEAVTVGGVG